MASASVAAVFVMSVLAGLTSARNESTPLELVDEETRDTAKWTVLVYLLADNNLDEYTADDFQELKDGGSSEDVNVLMLVDRLYEPAYLYCIEDNDMVVLESLGEINMGDPAMLTWFVEYSDTNYPAEHMVLFFWDHGSPTAGVGLDETMEDGTAGGDWLTHHEMIAALEGHHMDVIAADECSVGQMETIYEYLAKGLSVDYVVASESYIGWRGFSYDKINQALVSDPDMDARELSLVIVNEFTNLFSKPPYMSEILTTQSVFDMSRIGALGEAVIAMADTLAGDIDSYRSDILAAQASALMPWGSRSAGRIDMPTFVETLMDSLKSDDAVMTACEAVMAAYAEAMIGMGVTKNSEMLGYQGMGILFPPTYSMMTVANAGMYETYSSFEFPNMGWLSFLESFWAVA